MIYELQPAEFAFKNIAKVKEIEPKRTVIPQETAMHSILLSKGFVIVSTLNLGW